MYAIRSYYDTVQKCPAEGIGVRLEERDETDFGPEQDDGRTGAVGAGKLGRRITSYNVCYTKLLRGPQGRRSDRCHWLLCHAGRDRPPHPPRDALHGHLFERRFSYNFV